MNNEQRIEKVPTKKRWFVNLISIFVTLSLVIIVSAFLSYNYLIIEKNIDKLNKRIEKINSVVEEHDELITQINEEIRELKEQNIKNVSTILSTNQINPTDDRQSNEIKLFEIIINAMNIKEAIKDGKSFKASLDSLKAAKVKDDELNKYINALEKFTDNISYNDLINEFDKVAQKIVSTKEEQQGSDNFSKFISSFIRIKKVGEEKNIKNKSIQTTLEEIYLLLYKGDVHASIDAVKSLPGYDEEVTRNWLSEAKNYLTMVELSDKIYERSNSIEFRKIFTNK